MSVVTLLSPQQGVVVGLQSMYNKTTREIATIQTLLEILHFGRCVSAWMRCTSQRTVEQIITRGNDYLIAVKANQPKLWLHLQQSFEQSPLKSGDVQVERARDRTTERMVSIP